MKTVILKPVEKASEADIAAFLNFLFDVLAKDVEQPVAQSNTDVVECSAQSKLTKQKGQAVIGVPYIRVSHVNKEHGITLDVQMDAIRAFRFIDAHW